MPQEYWHASRDFERFMAEAKEALGHGSRHQTYTTVDAVLTVFRRRLTVRDGLRFANVLPPVLRAIFVAGWDPDETVRGFGAREELEAEVRTIREHHNFAPAGAIAIAAAVLRRHVDAQAFEQVLKSLPHEASEYWKC
jgi:uncharacterized protein (DUF2267 family)